MSKKPEPCLDSPCADLDAAEQFLDWLYEQRDIPVAVDTETTGVDNIKDGNDYCIGVSIAARRGENIEGYYYPVAHLVGSNVEDRVLDKLHWILTHRQTTYWQNSKFDFFSLDTIGITVPGCFFDTLIMAQLVDENTPISKNMNSLSLHYLGKQGKVDGPWIEWNKKTGNREITYAQMWDYAVQDAVTTYELAEVLIGLMDEEMPRDVWEGKSATLRVLFEMEKRGVRIDTTLAQSVIEYGEKRMAEIEETLGISPSSRKGQEKLLLEDLKLPVLKTSDKTGSASFDKSVMIRYEEMLEKREDKTALLLKEFRGWQKAVSASYKPYVNLVSEDGRLRCNYRLDRTATGRMASQRPNLQQIPKSKDKPWNEHTKDCFIPEPGFVLVNADYSQLELRLATAYADEPHLKEVFREGRDIFSEMAETLGFDRQTTKTFVYSTQYGGGVNRIKEAFGVSKPRAEEMLNNYAESYPKFKHFNQMCTNRAEQEGKVKIWSGRYRHFKYKNDSYKAMNSVIQGGAADIVERVMVRLFEVVDGEDCRMLMQVHDAVVFEVREDVVNEYMELIKSVMEDIEAAVGHSDFNDVKFAVEIEPDYGSKGWAHDTVS